MAKKTTSRVIQASEDLAGLIDRGGMVDENLKNLTVEDKGIKAKLTGTVKSLLQPEELSLRVEGSKTTALVSATEKYTIDIASKAFEEVSKATRTGLFGDAVSIKKTLVIAQDKIEAAYAVLKQMGMADILLETSYDVSPQGYRDLIKETPATEERKNAVEVLKTCVSKDVSYRVSFDKK